MWGAADRYPSREEMRQTLVSRHGAELQTKLEGSTVAICGLGGLGSNLAIALARAGVGRLILLDFDQVDITNLNRQQYKVSQLGQDKTQALAENLREIAPYVSLTCHSVRVTEENLPALLQEADIICEAFDQPEAKAMLVNGVLETLPGKALVAASGMAGLGSPNAIRTRQVGKHFYLCGDEASDVAELGSLFAPQVMLCAAHQAQTVLRILAGEDKL